MEHGMPDQRERGELAQRVDERVAALDVGELVRDGGALLRAGAGAEVRRKQERWMEDSHDDGA